MISAGLTGALLIKSPLVHATTFSCPVKRFLPPDQVIVLNIDILESPKALSFYLLRNSGELDSFLNNPYLDQIAEYERMLKDPNLDSDLKEILKLQITTYKEIGAIKPLISLETDNLVKDEGSYIEFVSNDENLAKHFGFPSSTASTNISVSMKDKTAELGIAVQSSKSLVTENKFLCERL